MEVHGVPRCSIVELSHGTVSLLLDHDLNAIVYV